MVYSIKGFKKLYHFENLHKIGESHWKNNRLVHFNRYNETLGCSFPDCFGQQMIHNTTNGKRLGYSRKKHSGRITFYNTRGQIVGVSKPIPLVGWVTKGKRIAYFFTKPN